PYICTHSVKSEDIKGLHLHLPPSLGDASVAGGGDKTVDDLTPEMAKIAYSIKAKLARRGSSDRHVDMNEKSVKIRIVPAKAEEPPRHIEEEDYSDYILRKEKSVKRGLFKI